MIWCFCLTKLGPHTWRAYGPQGIRFTVTVTPSGFERFFQDIERRGPHLTVDISVAGTAVCRICLFGSIRLATVSDDGIAGNSQLAGRRQDPDALVSEPVDVRRDDARWHDPEPIGVMRSCAREGCTFSMKIIGVACADS